MLQSERKMRRELEMQHIQEKNELTALVRSANYIIHRQYLAESVNQYGLHRFVVLRARMRNRLLHNIESSKN
jgi:hypothetical protein